MKKLEEEKKSCARYIKAEQLVKRVCYWNSARYDRTFDYMLAAQLQIEETEELIGATDPVEILDAVGDITFVVVGNLWKLGVHVERIAAILRDITIPNINPHSDTKTLNHSQFASTHTIGLKNAYELSHSEVLLVFSGLDALAVICNHSLFQLGLQDKYLEVLEAICDSNDTKSLPKNKVDNSVKANINKGEGFIPPTKALKELLDDRSGNTCIA